MKCKQARTEILKADLFHGGLPDRLKDHIDTCEACSRVALEARALTRALSEIDRPKLPGEFEQKLRTRLSTLPPPRERRWIWRPVFAIPAATLAAVLLVVILRVVERPGPPGIEVRYANIELSVEAQSPVRGVLFSLVLPEGIDPFGNGEAAKQARQRAGRTFHWTADLTKGENRYHLPVTVSGYGAYQVRAALSKNQDRVEAVLTLEVDRRGLHARFSSAYLPVRSRLSVRLGGSMDGIQARAGS